MGICLHFLHQHNDMEVCLLLLKTLWYYYYWIFFSIRTIIDTHYFVGTTLLSGDFTSLSEVWSSISLSSTFHPWQLNSYPPISQILLMFSSTGTQTVGRQWCLYVSTHSSLFFKIRSGGEDWSLSRTVNTNLLLYHYSHLQRYHRDWEQLTSSNLL